MYVCVYMCMYISRYAYVLVCALYINRLCLSVYRLGDERCNVRLSSTTFETQYRSIYIYI